MTKANMLFDDQSVQTLLGNLWSRWQDERQYENLDDYAVPVIAALKTHEDVEFLKMTKRPFGFQFRADDKTYQYTVTALGYSYKRIA